MIRTLCIASLALLVGAAAVRAEPVAARLHYTSRSHAQNVKIYTSEGFAGGVTASVGIMNLVDIDGTLGNLYGVGPDLYGFCVEMRTITEGVHTFEVRGSLSMLDQIGEAEAALVNRLWDVYFPYAIAGATMNQMIGGTPLMDPLEPLYGETLDTLASGPGGRKVAVALQVAIWEAIYGNPDTDGRYNARQKIEVEGGTWFYTDNNDVAAAANWLLWNLDSLPSGVTELSALYNAGGQDFTVLLTSGSTPAPIPLPPSMAMALMGLVGAGGFARLRRKK